MISFDEASAIIAGLPDRMAVERVPLGEAAGRVLAADVVAALDSPRSDVSAMDGYAVRDADLASLPVELIVAGTSFAGQPEQPQIAERSCVRIFTGGALPSRLDRVVIQEIVRREGDTAVFERSPGNARHIRTRGSDFHAGEVLLKSRTRLNARSIVAAAGADVAAVDVHLRPRLIILGTGDELAEPGTARDRPAAIPQSVSFGVATMADQWGGDCIGGHLVPDDPAELERAAGEALSAADLVVVTGGASVGEKDYARSMFDRSGLELLFSKVAIKPGKPVWLGRSAKKLVLGLPGNPTSAMVTARLFLAPLLLQLSGAAASDALSWQWVPLANSIGAGGDRETFVRGSWSNGSVIAASDQDSSAQLALATADVLIRRVPGAPALGSGQLVEILDF
jgi:molybdopterin molybdotransferase